MSFAELLREAEPTADGFTLRIPETWHQGRTAYGGLTAALALEAALRIGGGDIPVLRSALISFVGPLAGDVRVTVRRLRSGRNAHWLAAEITGEGGVGLTAGFVFMRPGTSTLTLADRPPPADLIPPAQAKPLAATEFSPAFLHSHFDVRYALPRSPEKTPDVCRWVRPKELAGVSAMTSLLLTADALPPAVLPLLSPTARISSMTWQFNLLTSAPQTGDGWWLIRSIADQAGEGCSSERTTIWNADGIPMSSGMQAIALFD